MAGGCDATAVFGDPRQYNEPERNVVGLGRRGERHNQRKRTLFGTRDRAQSIGGHRDCHVIAGGKCRNRNCDDHARDARGNVFQYSSNGNGCRRLRAQRFCDANSELGHKTGQINSS